MKAWLAKKSVRIGLVFVVLIIGWVMYSRGKNAGPFYETQAVERGTLRQTVEVTGEVKPQTRLELSFKTSGKLDAVNVMVAQVVKRGDVLASLDASEATFAMRRAGATVAQARANLLARESQDSPQAIQIAEASRDQAKAQLEKAQADLEQIRTTSLEEVRLAQIALDTAEQNLRNSGTGADLTVQASTQSIRTTLITSMNTMASALIEGDAIIGVENTGANDAYEAVIGIYDTAALSRAKNLYGPARTAQRRAETLIRSLTSQSSVEDVLTAAIATQGALEQIQVYLDEVQKVLVASTTNTGISSTELATKRSSIQTLRGSVSTQLASVTTANQSLESSENSRTTSLAQLQNAVKTAQSNLAIAQANQKSRVKSAETTIEIQRAQLASAEATLSQRKNPARAVDLQVLRAQVQDASIAYEQAVERVKDTQLIAPADGVISEIVPSRGEQIVQNANVMGLVATELFTVEALVPEADIAKVKNQQPAEITLDAYGDEVKFKGVVLTENPDRTKIQDAVFYKVVVEFDRTDRELKPGMTANVTITTGEVNDALIIPVRAIKTEGETRRVRVKSGENVKHVAIETGLRGDDGKIEVKNGLVVGEDVITAELTAEEYRALQAQAQK